MSLQDWSDNGWLKPHQTSPEEIDNLLAIVQRDLTDADNQELSMDWRFGIAYNAALKLCSIILYLQGYRPENTLAHYRTIMSLKEIDNQHWLAYSTYLNACRILRNTLEYDHVVNISEEEVNKLIQFTKQFHLEIQDYLAKHCP